LQVRRYATGRVSAAFGRDIQVGHPVEVEGPFGSAYFRHGSAGRLVIVSSGTGFAPVWSIADAALRENANRAILVLAGARTLDTLYMAPALQRMSTCPNVMIVPLVAELQQAISVVRRGRPEDYASCIVESDVVHAAGTPDMVSAVAAYAVAAGATFHADPFVVGPQEAEISLTEKARRWLGARREPWQRNYASSHQQELSSGPRI
jgi:3-phenylpropionate/trans-cinnamate dioxygenase ferredoxin reductase subunit